MLQQDARAGRCCKQPPSFFAGRALEQSPLNILALETLEQCRLVLAKELYQGQANNFLLVPEPSTAHQQFQLCGQLIWQVQLDRFHKRLSILQRNRQSDIPCKLKRGIGHGQAAARVTKSV
jgi:hypothetical protein